MRMITYAPELEGAIETTASLKMRSIVPTIGHSYATYNETMNAIEAGMTHVTHVFNGMRPFNHREPGVLGAVLDSDNTTVQLIADGHHIHPAAIRILLRCKGWEKVALITDATSAANMPEGSYCLG
jgi:N-acetylglucosamine-6-phosphate deacetylase